MGASTTEKSKIASYQVKDGAYTCHNKWKDSQALAGGPVTWKIFKKAFLERFFLNEQKKAKVEEFINLCQGGMSVKKYYLESLLNIPIIPLP